MPRFGGVCGAGACRHDTDAASSDLKDKLLAAVRLTVEANHICAAMEQRVAFEVELGVQVTGAVPRVDLIRGGSNTRGACTQRTS